MKITPLDIRRKEFKRSMRGYSDEEVDIFLDEVADEFERVFQENMELQDRAHRLDEQIAGHAQLRDALEKTLISAQLQAEELRANAHKESELILRDAELKARGIVSSSYAETQRTQQALVQLKLLEEDFRFKFRSLLEGYLRLLSEAPLTVAAAETGGLAAAAVAGEPEADELLAAVPPPVPVEMKEEPVRAPVPPPVVEAIVATADPAVVARSGERAAQYDELWPTTPLDEEVPTEETPLVDAEPPLMRPAAAGAVSPRPPSFDDASQEAESPRGFFFGRRMDDVDDTFVGDDVIKKDKPRDFEW